MSGTLNDYVAVGKGKNEQTKSQQVKNQAIKNQHDQEEDSLNFEKAPRKGASSIYLKQEIRDRLEQLAHNNRTTFSKVVEKILEVNKELHLIYRLGLIHCLRKQVLFLTKDYAIESSYILRRTPTGYDTVTWAPKVVTPELRFNFGPKFLP